MGLSCGCDYDDYEWWYELPWQEYSANITSRCYGCGDTVRIGDEVRHIFYYETDEYGNEENHHPLGRICEKCSGHYDSLTELGYCLSADFGFIARAMDDYRNMLPKKHIMKAT